MKKNTTLLKGILMAILFFAFGIQQTHADTYTVTSTSLTGPGSFLEAIELANNNPGPDIIEFTDGLQVDAATTNVGPGNPLFLAKITESLIIDGKGGALNGKQTWVNATGILNPVTHCPKSAGYLILAQMPGFIEVGVYGKDNTGIDVTIKNLTIEQFNQVADVSINATLTFENFKAIDTWATYTCQANELIGVGEGASLTITDSKFLDSEQWAAPGLGAAIVSSTDAGDLVIEGSEFDQLNKRDQFAINWIGRTGSEVNIVSSRFKRSGGIIIQGEGETNIVNTIWVNYFSSHPEHGDRIINSSNGDMNITASSLMWNDNHCNANCQVSGYNNLIERRASGKINFLQSAIGFNFDTEGPLLMTLGDLGTNGFTADIYTWIQPTEVQDAAALKTITNQPLLLTDLPAFNSPVWSNIIDFDVEMVTPAFPGELIDIVPSGIPVINPITDTPIDFDVVGNPREDANGERDIGALQLSLAPYLGLTGTGDGTVDLIWNEPLHHDGLSITKYEIRMSLSLGSIIITIDPPVLMNTISGLTNGTEYNFQVRAVYTGPENGPYSNAVLATPFGSLGTPVVTAVAGNKEVALSWTLPDLGERTFESFTIMWRIAGTTDYTDVLAFYNPGTTTTTITGLKNGTTYEFAVGVLASGIFSEKGLATATPFNSAPPVGDDCTLSHGYWKKHSEYGPAPYNTTWALLADGANTPFFLSGQTYYEVIKSPTANNAYYILGHQYIAAELNILQGADPTDAQAAFDAATILFNTYVPADIAGLPGSSDLRAEFIAHADLLEMYNTGEIGPGYCEEFKSAPIDPDVSLEEMISYYPNPVKDMLYIKTDKDFRITVISPSGQVVVDAQNEKAIDVSQLNNGLYIIRIEIEGRFYTDKISKH